MALSFRLLPAALACGVFFATSWGVPSFAQTASGQGVLVPPANIGGGAAQPPATFAQANPAASAETNLRVDRLEGELRNITGQMEQLMFQMRQLQDELRRAREDTEFRLLELEGNGTGMPMERSALDPAAVPAIGPEGATTDEQLREVLLSREQTTVLGAEPRDLGTLSVDASGQPLGATLGAPVGDPNSPLDLSSLTLNAAPEVRPAESLSGAVASLEPAATLSANDVYELGYSHVLRGDYSQAISTFGDFIELHPEDRLRPNAHFWLGESHFAMGAYTPAAEQFLAVFNNYPEDIKVPDALLKLGMSLDRLGAQSQACATYNKLLTDYPRAPQIVLDTARTEQGRTAC